MASSVLEQRDLARRQRDDGPLRGRGGADAVGAAGAPPLALAVERVDLSHLDAPDRLDGVADLWLARRRVDLERVDAGFHERVALLRHDRREDDVAGVLHLASSSSSRGPSAGSWPCTALGPPASPTELGCSSSALGPPAKPAASPAELGSAPSEPASPCSCCCAAPADRVSSADV